MQEDLDIILPVHNERETIEGVLQEWTESLSALGLYYRFIICEDGSTDGTKELLTNIATKYSIVFSQKAERRGYGRAVMDGIQAATAKYVLCIDSDGQCDPQDFVSFWRMRDVANVLIGWRTVRADSPARKLYSLMFKTVFYLLFPTKIHDPSAPYVLFEKNTVIPYLIYLGYLQEGFWWGFVGTCMKVGLTINEIPIHHRLRKSGKTQVYTLKKIPSIAVRNIVGLLRLRFSTPITSAEVS